MFGRLWSLTGEPLMDSDKGVMLLPSEILSIGGSESLGLVLRMVILNKIWIFLFINICRFSVIFTSCKRSQACQKTQANLHYKKAKF